MCDYTKVEYKCGHVRYIVKAWCVVYQQTQQRCEPNVIARETRDDDCGDCKQKQPSSSASSSSSPQQKSA